MPIPRPSKILVTRTDRIGDLVLSTPVFSELRKAYPNARIACLTFLSNKEIVRGNPFLDEVLLYDKEGSERSWPGQLRFARKLAAKNFDVVIHLHATNRMHWLGWMAGIPCRIGWMRKSRWTLTHAFPDIKKEGQKHEAAYNFELLKPLEIPEPSSLETYFPVPAQAERSLERFLFNHEIPADLPFIVIHPSASCLSKRWPPSYFARLIENLNQNFRARFLLAGTRTDRDLIQTIRGQCPKAITLDLSGKLNLGMLGALLKRAALLISNDSGPVHIASAVKTPVVAIFGRKEPGLGFRRWRPLGEKSEVIWKDVGCDVCLAHLCQINFLCLEAVLPEDIAVKALKLLQPVQGYARDKILA